MSDGKSYKNYFNIDPKYYAAVTEDLINRGDVKWEKFYPHESFVKLLEKTEAMLSKRKPASLWVEGAYGTGKTHAVLTLKALLEAPEEKVRAYFADYGLKSDLCKKFLAARNPEKLLTIYRTGSSSIRSDEDLILAVQESITAALQSKNIEKRGEISLRETALKRLESSERERKYFQDLILDPDNFDLWDFDTRNIDRIIQILKGDDQELIESLMRSLLKVAKKAAIELRMDANGMPAWIKSIIEANKLSAIVFVWDEFTEYFNINQNSLTGFQELVEISSSAPFYFVIVTHESGSLIKNGNTRNKIMDRFVDRQTVAIDLPDKTAFDLMAKAMKITDDSVLHREWTTYRNELIEKLGEARGWILKGAEKKDSTPGTKVQLTEEEMNGIVPIHPYAALMLKHMSVLFNSNARSMFDFIKNDDMEDAKGFKWFINNYGPRDDGFNLLTVDMLWDFFAARSQIGLDSKVRPIFDSLSHMKADALSPDEERVFKTIALLEAVSQRAAGVDLLQPTDANLRLAFSGTKLGNGRENKIAGDIVDSKKGILFKRGKLNDKVVYSVIVNTPHVEEEIEKLKEELRKTTKTTKLITDGKLDSVVPLPAAISGRFVLLPACAENFTSTANKCLQDGKPNQLQAVIAFAKDEEEETRISSIVSEMAKNSGGEFIFIESLTSMGHDLFEQYIDQKARATYYSGKDNDLARDHAKNVEDVLNDWRQKIFQSAFRVYTQKNNNGERCPNGDSLVDELKAIDRRVYQYGLEHYTVLDTLFSKGPLAQGAECGINQELKGLYRSQNKSNSLETALEGAWHVENYWKDTGKDSQTIVRIKKHVEGFIAKKLREDGRVSILEIFQALQERPYGFMPNNLSAFAMGFLLKEYANSNYFWTDNSQSEPMSIEKMKTAIANAINETVNKNPKFKKESIVSMSPAVREFLRCTASVFGISGNDCNSIEGARRQIRTKMREFSFPLWTLKSILDSTQLNSSKEKIAQVIDCYVDIANNTNVLRVSESGLAEQIGQLAEKSPEMVGNLTELFTSENCRRGMTTYLAGYKDGILPDLAKKIDDGSAYLGLLKERFSADGNWVWDQDTANQKIDDLILEYQIIDETNKYLPRCSDLKSVVQAWNNRCDNIRIASSVLVLQKVHSELKPLIEILNYMKLNNQLPNYERQKFYNALDKLGEKFDEFYKNQLETFKSACGVLLDGLGYEDIYAIYYKRLSDGQFVKDQTEYFRHVEEKVKEYIKEQKRYQLNRIWKEKTGTKDPSSWSDHYRTPILCMFEDSERDEAKERFEAFFASSSDRDVEITISYLEKGNFYDRLASKEERDKCFMERFVGKYAVMFRDADAVRDELSHTYEIYAWMDDYSARNKLEILAKKQYMLDGYPRAKSLIDGMSSDQLREYMNRMLEDNLDVGIEILKKGKA